MNQWPYRAMSCQHEWFKLDDTSYSALRAIAPIASWKSILCMYVNSMRWQILPFFVARAWRRHKGWDRHGGFIGVNCCLHKEISRRFFPKGGFAQIKSILKNRIKNIFQKPFGINRVAFFIVIRWYVMTRYPTNTHKMLISISFSILGWFWIVWFKLIFYFFE